MNYPDALFNAFMYPLEAVKLASVRRRLLPEASGDVLEIGAGTGTNLAYYDPERVRSLTLTDIGLTALLPDRALEFRERAGLRDGQVRLREVDAHALPFADESFDTVVATLVLCSVRDQDLVLGELRRTLRRGGRLIFIEHVRPPGAIAHLVDFVNPVWHAATGECNIDRDTGSAIERAGFTYRTRQRSGAGFLTHGVALRS